MSVDVCLTGGLHNDGEGWHREATLHLLCRICASLVSWCGSMVMETASCGKRSIKFRSSECVVCVCVLRPTTTNKFTFSYSFLYLNRQKTRKTNALGFNVGNISEETAGHNKIVCVEMHVSERAREGSIGSSLYARHT